MITTMTDCLSYYNVVDAATQDDEQPFNLTSKVFTERDEAYRWIWSHEEDLRHAVEDEVINGVAVTTTKILASFFVVNAAGSHRREVPSYLGFGARLLGETEHFYIVGVPAEHATWQRNRLGSGLHHCSPLLATLEEAQSEAATLEQQLYGAVLTAF